MNITTFKKGETVIAYPSDSRERVMHLTVKSVTDKYVSCVDNESGKVRRFNNDGKWFHWSEWMSYRLYHDMDEVHKEYEDDRLRFQFREDATSGVFTPDEIRKFYEIHNAR